MIDWSTTKAAVWRPYNSRLRAVKYYDPITLDDLLGIERQKERIMENTERFLAGEPSNHVLLWGSRGTGKSSIVKALLNHYAPQGLRLLEVRSEERRVGKEGRARGSAEDRRRKEVRMSAEWSE